MTRKRSTRRVKVQAPKRAKPKTSTATPGSLAKQVAAMVLKQVNPVLQTKGKNSILGDLGMAAGNGISKFFGLGTYKLKTNSLYDAQTQSQVPFMHSTDESIRFRKREYIGDIVSSTGFTTTILPVNPGLGQTFPMLSTIASAFQEYRFKGLVFTYKSTSSEVVTGANTAMGTVSIVAQYRADALALTNKVAVLNEMWAADGKPCDTFCMPVECSPAENPMDIQYVRTGALPSNQDIKTFDLCKVVVATQGQQTAGTIIGELWVSYDVELFKPILNSNSNNLNEGWANYNNTGATATFPLGQVIAATTDTIGLTVTSTKISFPQAIGGTWVIKLTWTTGSVSAGCPTITATNASLSSADSTPDNGTTTSELVWFGVLIGTNDSIDDIISLNVATGGTIPTPLVNIKVWEVTNGFT